jgi:hypothetical protein
MCTEDMHCEQHEYQGVSNMLVECHVSKYLCICTWEPQSDETCTPVSYRLVPSPSRSDPVHQGHQPERGMDIGRFDGHHHWGQLLRWAPSCLRHNVSLEWGNYTVHQITYKQNSGNLMHTEMWHIPIAIQGGPDSIRQMAAAIYRQQKVLSHFPVCCWIDWLLTIKNCLIESGPPVFLQILISALLIFV